MAPDEYSKALDKALSDLQARVQQRDLLSAEIAGLRETVRVLSTLVNMPSEKQREVAKVLAMADYATPSLTDAIRSLLTRISPKEMTAIEVRNALEDSSNSEDFSNSLSACHAALKRMLSDGEVEAGPSRNGKATYRRILKLEPPPLTTLAALAGLKWEGVLFGNPVTASDRPPHLPSFGQRVASRGQMTEPPPPTPNLMDVVGEVLKPKKK